MKNTKEALQDLKEAIARDYEEWSTRDADPDTLDYRLERLKEFKEGLSIEEGRKYWKFVTDNNSVWGFVMKNDDSKFKKGDILKAASWAAPARNFARGNIFKNYKASWTSPQDV